MGASRASRGDDRVDSGVTAEHEAFAFELRRLREFAELSEESLGRRIGYDHAYISKMERARVPPTADFARVADEVLLAGGDLRALWRAWYESQSRPSLPGPARSADAIDANAVSMRVTHERTTLTYTGGRYRITVLRELVNPTHRSIHSIDFRIHVDAFPHDVEQSREHHRADPLVWRELDFSCWHARTMAELRGPGAEKATELIADPTQTETDKLIEGWIRFQGKRYGETLSLHPRNRMAVMHAYTVRDTQWGKWYQRRMRLPTGKLDVVLDFPGQLLPHVWGKTMAAGGLLGPMGSQIDERLDGDRSIWSWSNAAPEFGDRYRFEWRFGNPPPRQP